MNENYLNEFQRWTAGPKERREALSFFSGPLQLIDWAFALFDPRRQRAVEKLAHTMVSRTRPLSLSRSGDAAGRPEQRRLA